MKRFSNYFWVALVIVAAVAAMTLGGSLLGHTAGNQPPIAMQQIPFQAMANELDLISGQVSASQTLDIGVPGNHRMVIEFVSFGGGVPPGQLPSIKINTTVNGSSVGHYLTPIKIGTYQENATDSYDHYKGGQATRIYNDNQIVTVTFNRLPWYPYPPGPPGEASVTVIISGYLVPVSTP